MVTEVTEECQKQYPITRYSVGYNGAMVKLICRDKIQGRGVFEMYNIMECNRFEEWRINDNKVTVPLGYCTLSSGQDIFSDFEEAKKVSKERWDKVVAPNALYKVARFFNNIFECYLSDAMSKREAIEELDKYRHSLVRPLLYSYAIVRVD